MGFKEQNRYFKLGVTLTAAGCAVVGACALFMNLKPITGVVSGIFRILMPFVYGAVIAYLLSPLCDRFEKLFAGWMPKKRKLAAGLAIVTSLLLAVIVVGLLFLLILPRLWTSITSLVQAIPGELTNTRDWLVKLLESDPELQETVGPVFDSFTVKFNTWMETELTPTVQNLLTKAAGYAATFLNGTKEFFLGILVSIYMMAGRKNFVIKGKKVLYAFLPKRWAPLVEEELRYADRMFNGFLMGKLLDSAIIGAICFIFTAVVGMDSAVLISVIIGATNIIPFFGPFIGAIPCILLLLIENPVHALIFTVFIIVLQAADGNLIGPKILGDTTGISSFWVLFSILLFGGLWGLFGMIVGVPLFAVLYDIIRRLVIFGLKKHDREDLIEDPVPPAPAAAPAEAAAEAAAAPSSKTNQ